MQILQLTPQLPFPPDSGGRMGIFNSIKYTSRRHSVTVLSFVTGQTASYARQLEQSCARVVTVPAAPTMPVVAIALNLFSSTPYTITKFQSPEMARQVRQLSESGRFDLVHIDHLHMAQYVRHLPTDLPAVLREHNVESVIMRRFAERAASRFVKGYATLQAR
ncbi:MAG: hypothetical protein HY710_06175, partial [Candidatus Latescibacteria bacterium]|nr:hypothetical protein [Candidatus Latescibacterota bacterium]